MNTLSDDGRWIGYDLLAELASQSVQNAVLGFQDLHLILSHACLDEVEAFDHYAPEECGQFPRQGLVGDQAAAPCRHAAVKAAERDVFAARQATGHHTKNLPGSVAASFDRSLAFAALSASGSKPQPRGEVLFGPPFGQIRANFANELQDAVFAMGG